MVTDGSIPQGVLVPPGPWGAGVGWVERAMGRTGREEQGRVTPGPMDLDLSERQLYLLRAPSRSLS